MCRLPGDAEGSGHGGHRLAERQSASHVLTLELDELLAQGPQRPQRLIRRGGCRCLLGQSADPLSGHGHAHTTPMRAESLEGCRDLTLEAGFSTRFDNRTRHEVPVVGDRVYGCGLGLRRLRTADDRKTVGAVTERFLGAVSDGNGQRACAQLSDGAQQALEQDESKPCPEAVRELDDEIQPSAVTRAQVFVTTAKVDLADGRARSRGSRLAGGGWLRRAAVRQGPMSPTSACWRPDARDLRRSTSS